MENLKNLQIDQIDNLKTSLFNIEPLSGKFNILFITIIIILLTLEIMLSG